MTRLFGVIGHPIGHSLSPVMHEAALRALRVDARYTAVETPPRALKPILRALILAGVEGLNVTVPLKEAILPLLDRLDPLARAIGAVNTIVIRRRRAVGYNTDGLGFRRALEEVGWRARPTRAVILGAGGAARAVAWELARVAGSDLTIANRHADRARRLARWLSRHHPRTRIRAVSLHATRVDDIDLLVNATSIGMRPADGCLVALEGLPRPALVYDLVYHRPTALVEEVRRRGCVAANGLSMLLYQGAESFRLWWRRPAPLETMREALEQVLRKRRPWSTAHR